MATTSVMGGSVRRKEDPALITGTGLYTDDVQPGGQAHRFAQPVNDVQVARRGNPRHHHVKAVGAQVDGGDIGDVPAGPWPQDQFHVGPGRTGGAKMPVDFKLTAYTNVEAPVMTLRRGAVTVVHSTCRQRQPTNT